MNFITSHLNKYNVPKNLGFMWNLGFLLGCLLLLQMISGVLMVLFYYTYKEGAFQSVRDASVEPNFGWYIRNYHSIGVSMYFVVMYFHIWKGMWFSSRFLPWSWFTGLIIYVLSIGVAFIGYVLPDGQMSCWGATVIKNLLEWLGQTNVLIFGGETIGAETLRRFFLLHFILPVVVLVIVIVHIYVLHRTSSSNPMKRSESYLTERFFPWSFSGDVKLFLLFFIFISIQIGFGVFKIFQADPDNSIASDPSVTPLHIIPEWYLLVFYASLKVFPTKISGLLAMASILSALMSLVETRIVSPVLSDANYSRIWSVAMIRIIPALAVLGQIGMMVTNALLISIGTFLVVNVLRSVGKTLDINRVRC